MFIELKRVGQIAWLARLRDDDATIVAELIAERRDRAFDLIVRIWEAEEAKLNWDVYA